MTEDLLEELRRYVRFDGADERALRELHPVAAPEFAQICELFYARFVVHDENALLLHALVLCNDRAAASRLLWRQPLATDGAAVRLHIAPEAAFIDECAWYTACSIRATTPSNRPTNRPAQAQEEVMTALDALTHEHRLIEATLDAMLVWSEGMQHRTSDADRHELSRFITFLREFVDGCHHGKEEQILFPVMKALGISGPVGVMLGEHQEGRALVAALDGFSHEAEPWTETERMQIADVAITYVALMRQHICKEDTFLYPMALARITAQGLDELKSRLGRFEAIEMAGGRHGQLHRFAEALIAAHMPRGAARNLEPCAPRF